MMAKMRIFIIALSFIILIQPIIAEKIEKGSLEIFINGYKGGEVHITIFSEDFQKNFTIKNESITIENLTYGRYHVVADYNNMRSISTIDIPNETRLMIDFSTTSDLKNLEVVNAHIIVGIANSRFVIMEIDVIKNNASKYFRGDLIKTIPTGIDNYTVIPSNFAEIATQKADKIILKNFTIPANSTAQVGYYYLLKSDNISLYFDLPTKQVTVLTPINILAISSVLTSFGSQQLGNNTYNVYAVTNLEKGEKVKISFQIQEIQQLDVKSDNTTFTFLILGLILIFSGIILFLYNRMKEKSKDEEKKREDWKV